MTALDRQQPIPGHFASAWPAECGGPRRQKAVSGPGPAAAQRDGARLTATTRHTEQWNVMFVQRAPGELYLHGTTNPGDRKAYGWVERVDPFTLAPLAESGPLRSGNHVWCGGVVAHADGSLYTVNGCFVQRLDADCRILAERRLPVDRAHNGLVILSDGVLATKDLRLQGHADSTLTLLEPGSLEILATVVLPEPSMGRIAVDHRPDGEWIVLPGTDHLFRLRYANGRARLDRSWMPEYREFGGSQGMAWEACLAGDAAWIMDNGDIASVRAMFSISPNGHFPVGHPKIGLALDTPWLGAQRLIRIDWASGAVDAIEPFNEPEGWIIAPPVFVEPGEVAVCWDTGNGWIAAYDWPTGAAPVQRWSREIRVTMQPVVFPDSGEIVVNDYREEDGDDLVVLDIATGAELYRTPTGSMTANGMFLSPGWLSDVYYCSRRTIARVGPSA